MKPQIKTTLGELMNLADKAIEKSRLKMKYGSLITKETGWWWNKKYEYAPMSYNSYYKVLLGFHPWNELCGIAGAMLEYDPDTEVWISLELAGTLGYIVNKEE